MPCGQANPVSGGFELSGRWPFASGIRHSSWLWCGAVVPGKEPPEIRIMSFPKSDAEVIDDWHVSGLRGTGSCDVEVKKLHVPKEFTWALFTDPPQRGGPLYRHGLPAFVTIEHSAFAAGAARRVLDETAALSKNKRRGMPPTPLVERGAFQEAIGKSELQLGAARQLVLRTHEQAFEKVSNGELLSPRDQATLRGCACYITEVAQSVIAHMFRFAGAGALHKSSAIQRYQRDITAAGQHLLVSDSAYEVHGRATLGFDNINPMA
jgi:indole-3-acetate monooxygenase